MFNIPREYKAGGREVKPGESKYKEKLELRQLGNIAELNGSSKNPH